jgi:calcineurin-like phosphoesterase family protein
VIVPGDFGAPQRVAMRRLLAGLHGTKILVRGNHDQRGPVALQALGWALVVDKLMFQRSGRTILVQHRQPESIPAGVDVVIHGHTHGASNEHLRQVGEPIEQFRQAFNVCAELQHYYPLPLDTILKAVRKRTPAGWDRKGEGR